MFMHTTMAQVKPTISQQLYLSIFLKKLAKSLRIAMLMKQSQYLMVNPKKQTGLWEFMIMPEGIMGITIMKVPTGNQLTRKRNC